MKIGSINKKIRIPEKLVGKDFGSEGFEAVCEEIKKSHPYNRAEIARRVCRRLEWKSPGGSYQFMSARVALLRLHRAGLIELPPPVRANGNGEKLRSREVSLPPVEPLSMPVEKLFGLHLYMVEGAQQSALYNTLIDRFHYLGYCPMAGAQVRYIFRWSGGMLGVIGFGASAWKLDARDRYIGWKPEIREKNLHLIVNNWRFLILPWVRCTNLGSKILSLCAQRIAKDFLALYGYAPVLLETFVERDRFRGTCYKASNWVYVGQTQGRGKNHRYREPGVPVKDIWLYPLRQDFRHRLQSEHME